MRIAFFEIEPWEKEYIKKTLKNHTLKFFSSELSGRNISQVKNFDIISVFIYSAVDKSLLEKFQKLRLITTRSTGYDHIDITGCKEKNITVCNVPYYGENTVAEHTFGLILSLSRKIHKSYERTVRGDFTLEGLRGFDLRGKTIGVIGAGHIGIHVIRMAKGFEMNVLAYDIHNDRRLAKKLGFSYVSLEKLLKNSDIISMHAPYNKHTHHMINQKNVNLIKKGALLINTSRGSLVETEALVKALNNGTLGGAGLDVLEGEFFIKEEKQLLSKKFPREDDLRTALENHILLNLDNVIITPHNAFNSIEALQRILDTTLTNIQSFLKRNPQNIVR